VVARKQKCGGNTPPTTETKEQAVFLKIFEEKKKVTVKLACCQMARCEKVPFLSAR